MKGSTKGSVHSEFSDRLDNLRDKSEAVANSLDGSARPWMLPDGLESRDLLHVPSLHSPDWDRAGLNANYDEAVASGTSPGTIGDVVALKLQIDYMAMEERAFRLRHASIIRCQIHAHGRRKAHGMAAGLFGAINQRISNVLRAGGL